MATIIRVSTAADGTLGNNASQDPVFSPDGGKIAFDSVASNLVAGDTNGFEDVFAYDRQTGETTRVSVDSAGGEGNGDSTPTRSAPAISADGGEYEPNCPPG